MIVDCHTHLNNYHEERVVSLRECLDRLLAAMDKNRVDCSPDLKIVICHLGNPWFRDCMEVMYKNSNVYADISGLVLGDFDTKFERWLRKQIEEVILYAGEPRYLLYGTDWPLASMESYLDFMHKLTMPQRTKEMILGENTLQLFKLPPPPAPPRTEQAGRHPTASASRSSG